MCLYNVTWLCAMTCVYISWHSVLPCPLYCDRVRCHVSCLYTVTWWCGMSVYCDMVWCRVCILWHGVVSCPLYSDRVRCHVMSIYCDMVWCYALRCILWHCELSLCVLVAWHSNEVVLLKGFLTTSYHTADIVAVWHVRCRKQC